MIEVEMQKKLDTIYGISFNPVNAFLWHAMHGRRFSIIMVVKGVISNCCRMLQ